MLAELIHSRGSFAVSIEPRPGCSRMSRRQVTVFVYLGPQIST